MNRIRRFTAALLILALPLNVTAAPQEPYETKLRIALDDGAAEVTLRRAVPIITSVTDLDLLPLSELAAVHRDRRLTGGRTQPTAERQALEKKWGPDAFAAVWLRITGEHLPVRDLTVTFKDDRVTWTGEMRLSAVEDTLDIRVLLKKGVTIGQKELSLNGIPGVWAYGMEPIAVRHLRMLRTGEEVDPALAANAKAEFEPVGAVYVGELVFVEVEYEAEPPYATQRFVSRAADGPVAVYDVRKVPGRPTVFRSGPLLVDARTATAESDAPVPAGAEQVIYSPPNGGVPLHSMAIETARPSRGRTLATARILPAPSTIWSDAFKKAVACRAAGKSATEVSNRFIVAKDVLGKRTLRISAEDHAAAILLRDELVPALERYVASERRAVAESVSTKAGREAHAEYTAWLMAQIRGMAPRPAIADVEVTTPSYAEIIPLHLAFTQEMEARTFGGDRVEYLRYAEDQVRSARETLASAAERGATRVRAIGDCDVLAMLEAVRDGVEPTIATLQRKLMRPAAFNEPALPRWVPDGAARRHVATVGILAEAIKAQKEYSSADTNYAIAVVSSAFLGLGVVAVANRAGRALGYVASQTAARGAGSTALKAAFTGLSVADGALLANDVNELRKAADEVKYAEGLAGIGGNSRLLAARDSYEAQKFGVAINALLLGLSTGAGAALRMRGPRDVPTAPAATSAAGRTPPPPPAPAAQAAGGSSRSAAAVPQAPAARPPVTTAPRPTEAAMSTPPPQPAPAPTPAPQPSQRAAAAASNADRQRQLLQDAGLVRQEGLLDRPAFRDLPQAPRPDPIDLGPYRTPAERDAYGKLVGSDTAALPQAPKAAAPAPALSSAERQRQLLRDAGLLDDGPPSLAVPLPPKPAAPVLAPAPPAPKPAPAAANPATPAPNPAAAGASPAPSPRTGATFARIRNSVPQGGGERFDQTMAIVDDLIRSNSRFRNVDRLAVAEQVKLHSAADWKAQELAEFVLNQHAPRVPPAAQALPVQPRPDVVLGATPQSQPVRSSAPPPQGQSWLSPPASRTAPGTPGPIRQSAAEAEVLDVMDGVNAVGGRSNCFDCAMSAAQRLMGRSSTLAASNINGISRANARKLVSQLFQAVFKPVGRGTAARDEIRRQVAALDGDVVGIVTMTGTRRDAAGDLVGHAFNVVKRDGHVFFADPQTGRLFTNWSRTGDVEWTPVGRLNID